MYLHPVLLATESALWHTVLRQSAYTVSAGAIGLHRTLQLDRGFSVGIVYGYLSESLDAPVDVPSGTTRFDKGVAVGKAIALVQKVMSGLGFY